MRPCFTAQPVTLTTAEAYGKPRAITNGEAHNARAEARAMMARNEPDNWDAWHAPLGKGSKIACGPLSSPTFVSLDDIMAEALAVFVASPEPVAAFTDGIAQAEARRGVDIFAAMDEAR